jgi:hypothetical protein
MASGFSLGAAIGATGKFPKLKINQVEDETGKKTQDELQRIRNSFTLDKNKYHNIYVDQNKNLLDQSVRDLLQAEQSRDPNVIEKAYNIRNNINASQNKFQNLSETLFDFETTVENIKGKKSDLFFSPSLEKAYEIIKSSANEQDMFQKFSKDPTLFADGYFGFEQTPNGVTIKPRFADRIDFEKVFSKGDVYKLNENGVLMSEKTDPSAKGQTIRRFYSIPANRQEALELKKTDPNIKEELNAYDMGKAWFQTTPEAQSQYRSYLYHQRGQKDALDPTKMTTDQLYENLYDEIVSKNIPVKYENRDQMERRTVINIRNQMGQEVAPTDFTVGPMTSNYKGETNSLYTEYSASVSSEADGTLAQIPTNAYIVSLDSGEPAFSTTAQQDFTINRVAIFPAVQARDKKTGQLFLKPLTKAEKEDADKKGIKYLNYPFALGNTRQLNVSKAPNVGVSGYVIPLYEPDKDGKWIVPQESRKVKTTGGSPLLSQVTQRNKWDEATRANWDQAFFKIMKQVKDQNDIKGK